MKKKLWLAVAALIVGAMAFSSGRAGAQRGLYTSRSLEWLVANSDVVLRGAVVDVGPEEAENEQVWKAATVEVRETLKGHADQRVKFVFFTGPRNDILEKWKADKRETLWFLVDRAAPHLDEESRLPRPVPVELLNRYHTNLVGRDYLWSAVRLDAMARPDPGEPPPPLLNMDLRPLKEPGQILRAARACVDFEKRHQTRQPPAMYRLGVPGSILMQTGTAGDINEVIVPVDSRLERLARHLIRSPQDFPSEPYGGLRNDSITPAERTAIAQSNRDTFRAAGVRALHYFKSTQNAALLKTLLTDPAVMLVTGAPDEQTAVGSQARNGQRVYYVREAAYEVLHGWGIDVARPVLRQNQ